MRLLNWCLHVLQINTARSRFYAACTTQALMCRLVPSTDWLSSTGQRWTKLMDTFTGPFAVCKAFCIIMLIPLQVIERPLVGCMQASSTSLPSWMQMSLFSASHVVTLVFVELASSCGSCHQRIIGCNYVAAEEKTLLGSWRAILWSLYYTWIDCLTHHRDCLVGQIFNSGDC